MSWLREKLNDPNVHGLLALAAQIGVFIPQLAPFSTVLQTAAGVLTATTVALPEKGSLHAQDYSNIAGIVAGLLNKTPQPPNQAQN